MQWVINTYATLFSTICKAWGNIDKIRRWLEDTTYDGRVVYDVISSNKLLNLLDNPKVSLNVVSIWQGKYEMHSFLNYSINYQIIKSIVLKQKNLVGYSPDYADEMSISETIKKIRDKWKYRNKPSDKPAKAHYFMYEAWKRSMHIRYTFDAIFIIIVGIVLQVQMNDLQDTGQEWYRIYPIYWTKKMALEDTSLSASDRATAQASFIETEDEYLSIGNRAYHIIMGIYILFAIMYAYALRNVCQIIFAKLRNRTWESIRAEFVLSMMHFIITTTALYRYLTDHRYRTEPDSRYNHLAVIYPAYYEEKFLDMTLI